MMEVLLWFTKDTEKHPCPVGCQAAFSLSGSTTEETLGHPTTNLAKFGNLAVDVHHGNRH